MIELPIELEQEDDERWIAEIPQLPGVMVYGATPADARLRVVALAARVLSDNAEQEQPRGV